jgi:hypothetical protein
MLRAEMTCETPDYYADFYTKHGVENPPAFFEQISPGMAKIASLNAHIWLDLPRDFDKRYPSFDCSVPALIARVPDSRKEKNGSVIGFLGDCEGAPETIHLNAYGVIDSPDQFQEYFAGILKADERDFFVTFTEIRKDEEPQEGGWRWHKWGPYFGTQKPQCEYIYDEPEIESVYLFHIYEL